MSANTNLGPTPVNQGYSQLIHTGETGGIDGTLRTLYDGDGTASDLQIASNAVKVSTTLYIGSDTLQEYIQDTVGAMFDTNGSHTNITATYDDNGDGAIDLNATGAISSITGGTGINVTGSGDITISTTDSEIVHDNLSGFVANEHINHSSVNITAGAGLSGGGNITASRQLALDVNNLEGQVPALELADKVAIYDNSAGETNVATLTQLKAIVNTDTNQLTTFNVSGDSGTDQTISHGNTLTISGGNGITTSTSATDIVSVALGGFADLTLESSPAEQDLLVLEDEIDGTIKKVKVDNFISTDVTLAGSLDYITISGQTITRNAIDLTTDVTGVLPVGNGGTGLTSISTLLNSNVTPTSLGLVIGTNVQAYDAGLQSISGLTTAADKMIYTTALDTYAVTDLTSTARTLLDDTSIVDMRTTLGLGLLATRDTVDFDRIDGGAYITSAEAFSDSDLQLMTAAAIDDLIISKGYGTGTMSSWTLEGDSGSTTVTNANTVDIAGGTGITTVASLDAGRDTVTINFSAGIDDLSDVTINSGTLANGQVLKYSSAESAFVNQDEDTGISFNGSTANGLLTYGNSTTADVESELTYIQGGALNISGSLYSIIILNETDVTNNPAWWTVADGGNYSIRLNNTGTYPLQITTNASNNAVDSITLGYSTSILGNLTLNDSLTIGSGGNYAAGSIYSDSNWGMLFRAKQASPALAEFRWANSADSELMRIDTSGNVGIGVFPSQKLHVAGSVRADTAYYVDGNIVINTDGNFEVHDTRAVTPSTDIGLKGVRFDFKNNSADGLSDGGTYHGVMTFQQWNDTSGGHIHALGFTDNGYMHHRNASIGGTFGNWKKLIQEDNSGNVGIGTSPAQKLHISGNTMISNGSYYMAEDADGDDINLLGIHPNNNVYIGASNNAYAGGFMLYGAASTTSGHVWYSGNAEAMRIDSSQRVGIGTNSPGSYNSAGDNLVIAETSGGAGITLASATNGSGHILFADSTSGTGAYDGFIRYDHTTSSMRFAAAGGVERMRIDSSGNVGIGTTTLGAGAKLNVVSGSSAYTAQFSRLDADDGLFLHSEAAGTHYNWLISTQDNVDAGFEITPSTAVGNRSFTTPAFVIKADTGNVGIGGSPEGNAKLDIKMSGVSQYLKLERSSSSGRAQIQLANESGTELWRFGTTGGGSEDFAFWDGSFNHLVFDRSANSAEFGGSVGINVTPSGTSGRLDCSNDVVAYSTSDKRLKENIKPLDSALDKVMNISGVSFDWKTLTEEEKKTIHGNEGHDVGVIAQEIEEVLPEVVTTRDSGYKAVKYEKIVPLLIEAIKEQQKQINKLEEKLNG